MISWLGVDGRAPRFSEAQNTLQEVNTIGWGGGNTPTIHRILTSN